MWLRPDARDRLYALAADYGDLYLTETFRTCIDQELYAVASRQDTADAWEPRACGLHALTRPGWRWT